MQGEWQDINAALAEQRQLLARNPALSFVVPVVVALIAQAAIAPPQKPGDG